ncbi:MAG: type II toxin-antitoxin system RelE/ParE family toxin [Cytophagales bacterium]|nr:type II toxin-antitoxin system RelE/ParE family toxin [Cytophagales bacterium]
MARFKIEWSTGARNDLYNILEFFNTRNKSTTYSKKLFKKLHADIKLLVKNPDLGIKTNDEDVRCLISGDFEIIYEKSDKAILIVMIWPSQKDPNKKVIR